MAAGRARSATPGRGSAAGRRGRAAAVWCAAALLWVGAILAVVAATAPGAAAGLVRAVALGRDCARFEATLRLSAGEGRLCRESSFVHLSMARAYETARLGEHALALRLFQLSTHSDLASGVGFERVTRGGDRDLLSPRLALTDDGGTLRLEISGRVEDGAGTASVAYAVTEVQRRRLAQVMSACDAGVCGRFAETAAFGARAPVFLPRPIEEPVRAAMAPHVARLDRLDAGLAALGLR